MGRSDRAASVVVLVALDALALVVLARVCPEVTESAQYSRVVTRIKCLWPSHLVLGPLNLIDTKYDFGLERDN